MKEIRRTAAILSLSVATGLTGCAKAPSQEEINYKRTCGITRLMLQTDNATVTGSADDEKRKIVFCVTPKDEKTPEDLTSSFFRLTKIAGCDTGVEIATHNTDTGKTIDIFDVSMNSETEQTASVCLGKVTQLLRSDEA